MTVTDEQCDEIIAELNKFAEDRDKYDYGLPMHEEYLPAMREIIRKALNETD